jgi:hypothetical protein
MEICKPIFIVGCGRSGTTLLYELLAGHHDLAWFSNYTNKFVNQPWLSRINSFYKHNWALKNLRNNGIVPFVRPDEGYNLWNLFHPLNGTGDPPLFASDVSDANIDLMKKNIVAHIKNTNCDRFMNKNTRNTRRSQYLLNIFPDAYFIHVIRDGRAVTNSFLNVPFWKTLRLWYREDYKSPNELVDSEINEVLLAAKLWTSEVKRMLDDSKKIPKQQYMEIRYENLTSEPHQVVQKICEFVDMDYDDHLKNHIDVFNIRSSNYKWSQNFTNSEIELINNEQSELLKELGYSK